MLGAALSAAAFIGPVLLIVADFSTLFEIKAITSVVKRNTGGDHHAYALIPIALLAFPMAYGAATTGSRPPMAALAVLGGVAAIIVLAVDLPDVNSTGVVGGNYTNAAASPQTGFYLESLGAALLVISGVGGLILTGRGELRPPAALANLKLPSLRRPGAGSAARAQAAERDEAARAQAAAERAARRGDDS